MMTQLILHPLTAPVFWQHYERALDGMKADDVMRVLKVFVGPPEPDLTPGFYRVTGDFDGMTVINGWGIWLEGCEVVVTVIVAKERTNNEYASRD